MREIETVHLFSHLPKLRIASWATTHATTRSTITSNGYDGNANEVIETVSESVFRRSGLWRLATGYPESGPESKNVKATP